MRSAGIDLKKVERDQEEDARNLKSYLEQKRPPLVSRPKKTLHFQPPTGWHAPLPTVFKLPPDPGYVPPSNSSQIKLWMADTGSGLGWGAEAVEPDPADVWFYFTPHQDASYTFTAWFEFHGFYILQADDGWLTSCVAGMELKVDLTASPFVDRPKKSWEVIDYSSQNINDPFVAYDQVLGIFSDTQDFREGEPVLVHAHIGVQRGQAGAARMRS